MYLSGIILQTMNSYTYDELLNRYQFNEQVIESLTLNDVEIQINRRCELKQNKKNIKEIKYNIFLTRISSLPNVFYINQLKDKLFFLEEEKNRIFSKFSCLYVDNVKKLEICYGERLTINMLLRSKRNHA